MSKKLILASGSPRRKELLEQIGLSFEVKISPVEESYVSSLPDEIVKELAQKKAKACYDAYGGTGTIILGADTIVVRDGEILGKPKDEQDAIDMITSLAGRAHQVYTGVAVIYHDGDGRQKCICHAEQTNVYVQEMEVQEIRTYAATGEPMDKAGSYGIQGRFAAFIKKIEGDYFNVVGLPVSYVYHILKSIQTGF